MIDTNLSIDSARLVLEEFGIQTAKSSIDPTRKIDCVTHEIEFYVTLIENEHDESGLLSFYLFVEDGGNIVDLKGTNYFNNHAHCARLCIDDSGDLVMSYKFYGIWSSLDIRSFSYMLVAWIADIEHLGTAIDIGVN